MTDSEREAILDRRIQKRLATDNAYRNAENADEQAKREDEITRQEERSLEVSLGAERAYILPNA